MQAIVDPAASISSPENELSDGERIREARENRGLLQQHLAELLVAEGYPGHPVSISYWETGRRPVPRLARPYLRKVLGIDLPWQRP